MSTKEVIELLENLIKLGQLSTNYSNFIHKFPKIAEERKGEYYIHGTTKLAGTISGRPSGGGDINVLALPSTGSVLAKPVKRCLTAAPGRLILASDFSGQEDYAASVVSGDPEMLSGKLLGRDGHSSRVLAYVPEEVPDHVRLIKKAKTATKFYTDDDIEGVDKFKCK